MPTFPHSCAVCHQFRRILLIHRIRHPSLCFSRLPLLDAAETPHANTNGNGSSDGAEDTDLGAVREAVEALSDALWRRGVKDLQSRGITRYGLDGLPRPGCVAIFVLRTRGEVGYADRLHEHRVWPLSVVNFPASPLYCVIIIIFVPAGPDAYPDIHGRLRVTRSSVCIGIRQRAHDGSVDIPLKRFIRPPCRVIVIPLGWTPAIWQRIPIRPLHCIGRVALPVVVILSMGVVVPDELLVYLIQVIGLQYHGADDSLSRGRLEPDLDFAKEDIEFALNCGRVTFLGDSEGGT